ncbi:hypothetical protein OLMES_1291 [Oleiphilus messinensis]|uniref:Uncharacterized protein n=1 Tax=Oleiphilus messinensis TaxID=141451 RepID=A0A1Y0I554_9GAMM|nr:hypothetical protein [Oleiphilus messinensis]ARU55370.1 hypothetical protein OLMES_1291 [Oleiphilus messinensis]
MLEDFALIIFLLLMLFAIEILIFAQVTIRKLERSSELKEQFGLELISGWRILNVAQALAMPAFLFNVIKSGPLGPMFANAKLLKANTTSIDKCLAHLLFWTMYTCGFLIVSVMIADVGFGVFG